LELANYTNQTVFLFLGNRMQRTLQKCVGNILVNR